MNTTHKNTNSEIIICKQQSMKAKQCQTKHFEKNISKDTVYFELRATLRHDACHDACHLVLFVYTVRLYLKEIYFSIVSFC